MHDGSDREDDDRMVITSWELNCRQSVGSAAQSGYVDDRYSIFDDCRSKCRSLKGKGRAWRHLSYLGVFCEIYDAQRGCFLFFFLPKDATHEHAWVGRRREIGRIM